MSKKLNMQRRQPGPRGYDRRDLYHFQQLQQLGYTVQALVDGAFIVARKASVTPPKHGK